jgi:hypothetical protein
MARSTTCTCYDGRCSHLSTVQQCGLSCQMSEASGSTITLTLNKSGPSVQKALITMHLWRSPSRPSVISNSPCKQRGSRDFDSRCRMGQARYKHPLSSTLTSPMRLHPKEVKHSASFWEASVDKDIGSRDIPSTTSEPLKLRYPPHLISGWLGQADRLHGSPVLRLKILPVEQQEPINTELILFRMIACSLQNPMSNQSTAVKSKTESCVVSMQPRVTPVSPLSLGVKHRHVGQGLNHSNLFHSSPSTSVELKLLL